MRSRAKSGQSGYRYRATLKGHRIDLDSARGRRRRLIDLATRIRIRLEREALAGRNALHSLNETDTLHRLAGVPSVFEIAGEIQRKRRVAR
ncbi:MAG: hypothetical protein B7Y80_01670 [Hyphomicrobium sp. 32-62-53]|nr:MAG: hypothetical protein B7Y80_01670 [Hyphomicrobium sp. 32-62-53]